MDTMKTFMCYELFERYLIDDYLNVYRKQAGTMLVKKVSYYLKKGDKFSKFRPGYLWAWVMEQGQPPKPFIVDWKKGMSQGVNY